MSQYWQNESSCCDFNTLWVKTLIDMGICDLLQANYHAPHPATHSRKKRDIYPPSDEAQKEQIESGRFGSRFLDLAANCELNTDLAQAKEQKKNLCKWLLWIEHRTIWVMHFYCNQTLYHWATATHVLGILMILN